MNGLWTESEMNKVSHLQKREYESGSVVCSVLLLQYRYNGVMLQACTARHITMLCSVYAALTWTALFPQLCSSEVPLR